MQDVERRLHRTMERPQVAFEYKAAWASQLGPKWSFPDHHHHHPRHDLPGPHPYHTNCGPFIRIVAAIPFPNHPFNDH